MLEKARSKYDTESIRKFIRRYGDKLGPDFNRMVEKYTFMYCHEEQLTEFYYVFLAEFLTVWETPCTYDAGEFTVGPANYKMKIVRPERLSNVDNMLLESVIYESAGYVSPFRLSGNRPWSYQYPEDEYQLFAVKYLGDKVEGIIEIVTTDLLTMYKMKKELFCMTTSGSGLNNMQTSGLIIRNDDLSLTEIIDYFTVLNLPGLKSIKPAEFC